MSIQDHEIDYIVLDNNGDIVSNIIDDYDTNIINKPNETSVA